MNYLWGGMLLTGIVYGILTGRVDVITEAVLNSSKEAVTLCTTMLGVMGFWMGLMEIAREEGLLTQISRRIQPLIRFLFPNLPKDHPANEHITTNFVANVLGLGWAATPAGLKAMEELANLEEERRAMEELVNLEEERRTMPEGTASNEMCTFLILNISSLQLIPMNVIAYRSQYGSVDPAVIVGPGIVATLISTLAAVVFCKMMERRKSSL